MLSMKDDKVVSSSEENFNSQFKVTATTKRKSKDSFSSTIPIMFRH